ncbi:MAG: hypothetical protein ACTSXM_06755 [Promethearchaeota archaeon]
MDNYSINDNLVLDNLLIIPKKNLENRINQIEQEIKTRMQINDNALSRLSTEQFQLKERCKRPKYSITSSQHFDNLKRQIWQLELQILKETIACFKDISDLREKYQLVKEELELNELRLKLIQ